MNQLEQARAAVEAQRVALEAAEARLRELESTPDGAALLDAMLPLINSGIYICNEKSGKSVFRIFDNNTKFEQDIATAAEIVHRLNNYNQMKAALEEIADSVTFGWAIGTARESLRKLEGGAK